MNRSVLNKKLSLWNGKALLFVCIYFVNIENRKK